MRKFTFFFSIFLSIVAYGQQSYEFSIALPPDGESILAVSPMYFGTYQLESDYPRYEVNAAGIFMHSLSIHSISRDTLRESSSYRIKGDFLYGIAGYDSLPCVLEGDNYYFGITHKEMIAGKDSRNQLRLLSKNEYLLSFEENGTYVPCLFHFEKGNLKISYFDYDQADEKVLSAIKKKQEISDSVAQGQPVTLLLPTQKEWTKLFQTGIFGDAVSYKIK